MLEFDNGGCMVDPAELPDFRNAACVYLDFETTSGNPRKDSINPWVDCSVAGFAITVDDCPVAYYVDYMRLPYASQERARAWLWEVLATCGAWVNHNVKYDAHVAANCLGFVDLPMLVDTVVIGKMLDSDRLAKGGYSLDALAKDWLGRDITHLEKALQPYLGRANKDYGAIPGDVLGKYACEDVLTNRELYVYEMGRLPEQCNRVAATEIELTSTIFRMERHGVRVDMVELKLATMSTLNRMLELDVILTDLVGYSFRPHVSDDLHKVLCGTYGLPILAYTIDDKTGLPTNNPSFDKAALSSYESHPQAPKDVIAAIKEYKKLQQRLGLFYEPWATQLVWNESEQCHLLHATYNQCVRTGRMSCGDPNLQQCEDAVKKLIRPRKGCAFLSADYSQIEFRLIAHYIESPLVIETFQSNPDADFHTLVAGWCGIKRKPAKTINFGIAFGEGKKKLVKQLSTDPDLVGTIADHIRDLIGSGELNKEQANLAFIQLATQHAERVFAKYHDTFPTLKPTMKAVERALRSKGYVFNLYGRHRHLPLEYAYRAFNTLNQSSAADIMKERTNAICRALQGTQIQLAAMVHDEVLLHGPADQIADPRTHRDLAAIMERPEIVDTLRVPIRCAMGWSADNWSAAGKQQLPVEYNLAEATEFAHLKR
jgi:DNA polymerase-1